MMRRLLSVIVLLLLMGAAFTQSWVGSSRISSPNDITYIQSRIDQDQNVYIFGSFSGEIDAGNTVPSSGGLDYFICKTDRDGNPYWIKAIGSSKDEDLYGGMVLTSDGEIIMAGGFADTIFSQQDDTIISTGSHDIFLLKYSSDGEEIWLKNIAQGLNLQRVTHLSTDNNDNLILSGQFIDSIAFENANISTVDKEKSHAFFSMFSASDGSFIWGKSIEVLNESGSVSISESCSGNDMLVFVGSFADSVAIGNDTLVSINSSMDAFILNSDATGEVGWIQTIGGTNDEQATSLEIDENLQVYVAGNYSSPFVKTDPASPDSVHAVTNLGDDDLFVSKYSSTGQIDWLATTGGSGDEAVSQLELHDENITVSGYFSETLNWGDELVETTGPDDNDLFMGLIDISGSFKSIKTLSGSGNSHEESKGTYHVLNDTVYAIIYSNSSSLQLGDDLLTSPHENFHITLGIMGCLRISVDFIDVEDIESCYGDSTGSIQVFSSGGFGAPFKYSIDGGLTFQENLNLFTQLPGGDYQITVADKENCTQSGQLVTIDQPDSLVIELISSSDITLTEDGSIVVGAQGGTSPYTYTLQPDGIVQGFGTFTFGPGDSGRYVVELNDKYHCGPASTDTILIQDFSNVGMDEPGSLILRVFPNPATDLLTVEMPMEAVEVSMEILSAAGQVVLSRQAYTSGGVLRETIDVSDLAEGIYMLRLNGKTIKSAIVVR